ncbi:GAF domain-containing protein [Pseudonocardia dioxanivorans]|uniref:GAF domain-containing protein n=1 Tax=Pseudonocardia dioxanivorans TaxID=240495 RepID=UPI001043735A|nr:GAF domain-containing protein [Pseudonocardia dioxanivorans]
MAVLANDPALVGLALQVARTPAAQLDVGAVVAGVCRALPMAVGVAGAVVVLRQAPDPLAGPVFASDAAAMRLGELQHSRSAGPAHEAIRTGRVVATADLTRADTVEVAAVAAETGLASAVTVPLLLDGRPAGALQLLGTGYRPVPAELAETVRPLVEVLSARLADARSFRTLTAAVARSTAALEAGLPLAHATGILAERYRTDVEEAGRFLAGAAVRAGLTAEAHAAAVVEGVGRRDAQWAAARGEGDLPAQRDDGAGAAPDAPTGRRHRRDDATGPLSWITGDLPLPRHSRARRSGDARPAAGAPRHGRTRHDDGSSGDEGPGDPPASPRHRRADIS